MTIAVQQIYPIAHLPSQSIKAVLSGIALTASCHPMRRKVDAELDCLSQSHHRRQGVRVIQRKRCALFCLYVALFCLAVRTPGAEVR